MKGITAFYLRLRFFASLAAVACLYIAGFIFPVYNNAAFILLLLLIFLTLIDSAFLFGKREALNAKRSLPERLSNGDDNIIEINISNTYSFTVYLEIIDEIPIQLQVRDLILIRRLRQDERKTVYYSVRPVERGEYAFGSLNIFAYTAIGLVQRRYRFDRGYMAKVYPSILQMKKFEFFAISNRLADIGVKKLKQPGVSLEFDQIGKYCINDDFRKINWKASARSREIMVNRFRDERSQHIYSIIDAGRTMRMSFNNMTMLDYAINTSLVASNIAIRHDDRAGIIVFSKKVDKVLPAKNKHTQILAILDTLYHVKAAHDDSGFEILYATVAQKLKHRSLLMVYTNFETLSSLKRNIKYLGMIAKRHLTVMILFLNSELKDLIEKPVKNIRDIYIKTIAEKFNHEKDLMARELQQLGIHSILTRPEDLTMNAINKYIEFKTRGIL